MIIMALLTKHSHTQEAPTTHPPTHTVYMLYSLLVVAVVGFITFLFFVCFMFAHTCEKYMLNKYLLINLCRCVSVALETETVCSSIRAYVCVLGSRSIWIACSFLCYSHCHRMEADGYHGSPSRFLENDRARAHADVNMKENTPSCSVLLVYLYVLLRL